MKIYLMILFVMFGVVQSQAQCNKKNKEKPKIKAEMTTQDVTFKDLPDNAKLDDEVRVNKFNDDGIIISYEVITVEQKLREVGAKYVENKLVDKEGTEIRFYKPPIRGTSQGFEADKKQAEIDAKKLADLKEKYTVIEIFVNPLKFM